MADSAKYMPVNGGTLVSDFKFKKIFPFRTKRTRAFAYVFIAVFVGFTVFLAFNPSPNPSSPWFSNIFGGSSFSIPTTSSRSTGIQGNSTASSSSSSSSSDSDGSVRSQFSSIYSYFFPSNSSPNSTRTVSGSPSANIVAPTVNNNPPIARNQTQSEDTRGKTQVMRPNQTSIQPPRPQSASKQTTQTGPKQASETLKNATQNGEKSRSVTPNSVPENGRGSGNFTSLVNKQRNNGTETGASAKQGIGDLVKNLLNCNLFDGEWVRDESYPLYKPGSCSLIDEQFNCYSNGRPDKGFQMLKWKPKACTLPRLDGSHMLQLLRGKRLVFVGDSLNRNMWESLICILRNSVKDETNVYEASGRHHFRSEPSYSFVFKDYNCTVEFFVAPFIVRESETKDRNGTKKETLRLDLVGSSADQYKNADIVVFNTGHWWTHEKTAKGKDYYQEGSHVYSELNVLEAFRKAMTTWGRWVDANINSSRTLVFFRGYSASHFRGGQWNSGGQCDHEVEPIKNATYLGPYPDKMKVLEKVLRGMKSRVLYLNITRLTDFRKDGHPSVYRKQHYTEEERRSPLNYQDCSHWCLPGVPDSWNEILYAELLAKEYHQNQQEKHLQKG